MSTPIRAKTPFVALCMVAAMVAAPAKAIELDRYFPASTETLLVLNVQQLLNSKLIKNTVGVEAIKQALQTEKTVSDVLESLGLDITKDIDRIMVAGPAGGDEDEGLFIIQGRFNVEKFQATAKKAAKDNKDVIRAVTIKDGKGGKHEVFEVTVDQLGMPLFVAIGNKNTILAAPSKDYLIDALSVKPDQKAKIKSKEFADLISKLSDKQTISIALVGKALAGGTENIPLEIPEQVTDALEDIKAVAGGITVDAGIQLELSMATKDAKSAKGLQMNITAGLNLARTFLGFAAQQNPQIQPVIDFANSLKTTTKDNVVSIKGGVDEDDLKKLIPQDD